MPNKNTSHQSRQACLHEQASCPQDPDILDGDDVYVLFTLHGEWTSCYVLRGPERTSSHRTRSSSQVLARNFACCK